MKKNKTTFECQNCGNITAKWVGKCDQCQSWNSIVEVKKSDLIDSKNVKISQPKALSEIKNESLKRISTSFPEFDRVTGGGLVPGSVVFLGGAPGIEPATVVILGGGVVGENAALIATGMKSKVHIVDKSQERFDQLKKIFGNTIIPELSNKTDLKKQFLIVIF